MSELVYYNIDIVSEKGKDMEIKLADERKDEIINACEELYQTKSFKEITLKDISEKTTFSRPSIYNYFQTKEEIFLALLKREYERLLKDLEDIYVKNDKLEKQEFAKQIALSIEKREQLLKLLSMNLYDMEANSRMDQLVDFKKSYGESLKSIKKCLDKFFKSMKEKEKEKFIFSFFPLMYGIYPYTHATDKQKEAMKNAGVPFKFFSIYEMVYESIIKLL